jgi:hypothetical protein
MARWERCYTPVIPALGRLRQKDYEFQSKKKKKRKKERKKNKRQRQGIVAHICNPSYSGGEEHQNRCLRPVWARVSETLSQQKSQGWWCKLVIPATWEAWVRGL